MHNNNSLYLFNPSIKKILTTNALVISYLPLNMLNLCETN